ncbi:MAG TPA: hypothetical protein VGR28_12595 [Candidatus Thermoplasmatota archaeon]|jgi:plastocyanin|nr:hypothetical protein [Candidatus Thermoplasmatota archaeon]
MSRARSVVLVALAILPFALASSLADDGGSDLVGIGNGGVLEVHGQCIDATSAAPGPEACIWNPPVAKVSPGTRIFFIADQGSDCHTITWGLTPFTDGTPLPTPVPPPNVNVEGTIQGGYNTVRGSPSSVRSLAANVGNIVGGENGQAVADAGDTVADALETVLGNAGPANPHLDGGSPVFCQGDPVPRYEKTFGAADTGVWVYYCIPHFGKGMHGVVVVA